MKKNLIFFNLSLAAVLCARGIAFCQIDTTHGKADSSVVEQTAPKADSMKTLPQRTVDTAHSVPDGAAAATASGNTASASERMYRNSAQNMRRDMPASPNSLDTAKRINPKKQDAPEAVSPPPRVPLGDSYLVIPSEAGKTPSGHGTHLKKSGVFLIVGACALVGGAGAYYVLKSSQNKGAAAINNRIPPPPDPPAGGIFSNWP